MSGHVPGPVPTLVNGEPVGHLPVSDRGLAYGDGVFETIRLSPTGLVLYAEHIRRLSSACMRLDIALDLDQVHTSIIQLAESVAHTAPGKFSAGIIKLIVTRGDGGRGYTPPASARPRIIVQWFGLPEGAAQAAEEGISCAIISQPVSTNPALAGIKHLNRLDQVLGSRALQELTQYRSALREALMPDGQGSLIEGTRTNFFAMIDGQLCTPDLSSAGIAGVMRDHILTEARRNGLDTCIRRIDSTELALASEVFICNSVLGVWPVRELWSGAQANVQVARFDDWPQALWAQDLFTDCLHNAQMPTVASGVSQGATERP